MYSIKFRQDNFAITTSNNEINIHYIDGVHKVGDDSFV